MMIDRVLPVFRDEEAVVLDQIEDYYRTEILRTVETGTETPADEDLDAVLRRSEAFIRVGRVGGAPIRGEEHTDRPVVDVDVFATTRATAKRVAQEVEQLLLAARHPIDECNILMSPQKVPWVEGVPIRRYYASYHLHLRR